MTSPRSVLIRSEVCLASGDVVGVTWITSTPAFGGWAPTLATPGTLASAGVRRSPALVAGGEWAWATPSSGPLKPGPKPSASRSYAWRDVLDAGSLLASDAPSLR